MAPSRRIGLVLVVAAGAVSLVAGCGGDDSDSQAGAAGSPEPKVAAIRDRAAAAGYDIVDCVDLRGDEAKCSDDVTVSKDGAALILSLYGRGAPRAVVPEGTDQSFGVFRPGLSLLSVSARSTPEGVRSEIRAKGDSAQEKKAIEQGTAAYVVIGNRVWSTGSPGGAVIDEKSFLDVVGKLDGCAPDCRFKESSFDG